MKLRELTSEQLAEESLINLAYTILVEQGQAIELSEILAEIKSLNARTQQQMDDAIVQFYTDLNIDGRFLVLGEDRWGLREWYAIDQVEEETAPTVKAHKHEELEEEDLELHVEDEVELVLEDAVDTFDDTDLNEDTEDDELAGLGVVEEDIDLDEEDDTFVIDEDEEEK